MDKHSNTVLDPKNHSGYMRSSLNVLCFSEQVVPFQLEVTDCNVRCPETCFYLRTSLVFQQTVQ